MVRSPDSASESAPDMASGPDSASAWQPGVAGPAPAGNGRAVMGNGEPGPAEASADDRGSDAEAVLSQALRAIAGGQRQSQQPDAPASRTDAGPQRPGAGNAEPGAAAHQSGPVAPERATGQLLTTAHLLLLAAIVGLVVGMGVGFVVLLL